MQLLRLQYNHITGTLPPSWSQKMIPSLATLDISSNRLVGTLPPQWANTTSRGFSFLSLRNNSLSGTLPSAWSRLRHLSQLYLDTNRLSGSIPSTWGGGSGGGESTEPPPGQQGGLLSTSPNQPVLQVVTLQNNSLTGTIPNGIVNGSNLCILLLNDNRLRGRLPPLSPSLFRPKCTIYSGALASSQFRAPPSSSIITACRAACPGRRVWQGRANTTATICAAKTRKTTLHTGLTALLPSLHAIPTDGVA